MKNVRSDHRTKALMTLCSMDPVQVNVRARLSAPTARQPAGRWRGWVHVFPRWHQHQAAIHTLGRFPIGS